MSPTSVAVVAEKPSVARDIARVLGASSKGEGYLHGNGYIVTWAIGHLAALAQPHEIRAEWKLWRRDLLPMLPDEWPLVVYDKTRDQFETVRRILCSPRVSGVICATDAGREGELIFRYIYEAAGCAKPVSRLWISSLTPEAIRKGFDTLKPGSLYDPLADAARGRSRADWLVGMNLSRAYTLSYGGDLSVGRVQTPTLALLVERELAIRNFVPEDYLEVVATFGPASKLAGGSYKGTWFRDRKNPRDSMRLPASGPEGGAEADQIVARARTGRAAIESIGSETQRMAPPLLYDLTELQRHANRLYGFSALKTLDLAQALYERHKLISYPRTDSRHLSRDVAATLPGIVRNIAGPYRGHLAPGTGERPLGSRFVDDSKITDHHAIVPTTASPDGSGLSPDEKKIFDLVCRRLLSAWHEDYIWLVTTLITAIVNGETTDRYYSSGTVVTQQGWKALDIQVKNRQGSAEEAPSLPQGLEQGQPRIVLDAESLRKKTRAPKRLTEAALLTAMETAGKALDDKELSDAMKDSGLGTPATRAAIIEVLLKREYIERNGKNLVATEKGIHLIEVVHPEVKSPAMTGQWEAYLKRIERGQARLELFIAGIQDYVREVVGKVGEAGDPRGTTPAEARESPSVRAAMEIPVAVPDAPLPDLLQRKFGFSAFRASQEEVCRTVIDGRDVLLVMPTGAGKSLCYQLPGVARGGTTLVIGPLIALMEDQYAKLRALGFAVDCIHSGRNRDASRKVCLDYLNGRLQFLFIAPERLRVSGFPEMLARRKPSLIAIDEAHCISQWGHDFRPDYRLLGKYLPTLRPAPVIALTATATVTVQEDIRKQLGLEAPASFIHGFRRENISIEAVEIPPARRSDLVLDLLAENERRPAIVYTPSRKQAEALAVFLSERFPTAAYHAGLDAERRARVQAGFQSGKTEVIVATIAFGMGIDKPDVRTVVHTALPGSMEAYYQEVGRAGRDGKSSRAILMHSYADRYTHDFFFERDYPDVAVLDQIFGRLSRDPVERETLRKTCRIPGEVFEKAIEKLWTHGGAIVDSSDTVARGSEQWRDSYIAQGEQKRLQIEQMIRYAQGSQCRMATLVKHFGDLADARKICGACDFCAPDLSVAQRFRKPNIEEQMLASEILDALKVSGSRPVGRLHSELCSKDGTTRDEFEEIVAALARAGLLRLTEAVFEKDGREIPYRKAALGREADFAHTEILGDLKIRDTAAPPPSPTRRKRSAKKQKKGAAPGSLKIAEETRPVSQAEPPGQAAAEQMLRAWRLTQARRQAVPAFRIMTDKVLSAIASRRPKTAAELLAIPGIGIAAVEKYGAQIYRILNQAGSN